MLPLHIPERTRLDSTTNDSPDIRGRMYPSTYRDHTARLSFEWEEVKMEEAQVIYLHLTFMSWMFGIVYSSFCLVQLQKL
jgi:hypothetical protein